MPDWLNVMLRSLFFLVVLFFITKLLGKKQISQLSFFEYITGITIGNIGAELATKVEHSLFNGVVSIATFSLAPFIAGFISMKSRPFRNFVEGKGTVFIQDGKLLEDNLKKEKYTIDELLELLRKKDVFNVSDVEYAVLEATGDLNVLLKKENQPLTAKDLNLKLAPIKGSETVIMDGEILDESLSTVGRNRLWLKTELVKQGITVENVFLGQINTYGELTVDLYDDKLKVPSPQERPLLWATLKKCQADLELFALSTDSIEAKEMYQVNSLKIQRTIDKIEPILKS
ncbi:DUF421 domain-containing protein [Peribacillus psychrosaccharolyticus]|uniref:DUF421 domain-containing protein n=1 Tax=Peribacillus psychrosaccharolyticus TaxID=1407 RepID=A0A974NMH7_PERPY|nr:DUF421 domain-containing protein [Peribacillus psychrosaccharolyticus]MEC2056369.1 DUF421 domain-containing protein [Peribacillus psychrosaccharolyticus]MED3743771.1 DUF421 domain-containing protein [Peribacillus psychrosaccharolyticus]QQT00468.1 DUF421 domain-containing protein [Peribacillus psychrosaccharolyticus]